MTRRIFFVQKLNPVFLRDFSSFQERPLSPYGVTGRVIPATVTDSTVDRSRISSKTPPFRHTVRPVSGSMLPPRLDKSTVDQSAMFRERGRDSKKR